MRASHIPAYIHSSYAACTGILMSCAAAFFFFLFTISRWWFCLLFRSGYTSSPRGIQPGEVGCPFFLSTAVSASSQDWWHRGGTCGNWEVGALALSTLQAKWALSIFYGLTLNLNQGYSRYWTSVQWIVNQGWLGLQKQKSSCLVVWVDAGIAWNLPTLTRKNTTSVFAVSMGQEVMLLQPKLQRKAKSCGLAWCSASRTH